MRWIVVSKSWLTAIVMLLAVAVVGERSGALPLLATPAAAQDKEGDAKPAESEKEKEDSKLPNKDQSMLMWFITALGWRYCLAFGIISFSFVAFLVMNLLSCRRDAVCPRHLADAFEAHLNEKRFQEAFDLAKNDESFLGQMLAAGMQKLQQGYDKSMAAMSQVGEEESMRLEQRLSLISLIGSISPMVGLLGTVDGMVASFMVIAGSTQQPKPYELAAGISTALITTLVGLVIAIPAIIVFSLLKNRVAWMTMEVGQKSEELMGRFETMGKK